MDVVFTRTGERRYSVTVTVPGQPIRGVDPAPGYDDHIPHDLVHYIVEAELKLTGGLYGRAAEGGGSFHLLGDLPGRDRSRRQRKAKQREAHLRRKDHAGSADMERSERLAGLCDTVWRKRYGEAQGIERPPWVVPPEVPPEDRQAVDRIVDRLDETAARWSVLRVGEALTFAWPRTDPTT